MARDGITVDDPRALFAAVAFSAIAVLIFNALPIILGVASDTLGLNPDQLGTLASLELGGIGIASISGLFWIRTVPWRLAVALGVVVLAVGNVLSIYAADANALFFLRFFIGLLGEGVIFTVAIAALGDATDSDRAFAYSIVGQVGLGMVALWLFPHVGMAAGYTGIMLVMAGLAAVSLILLPFMPAGGAKMPPGDHDGGSTPHGSLSTPLLGLVGIVLWFVGLSGIWAFVERIGIAIPMEQTQIGLLLSLGLGLGAVAALIVALVGDRYGRYWPAPVAIAIHVVICMAFTKEPGIVTYSVLLLLFTFVWNIGLPYLLGLIADTDTSGRLVVLIVSAQALGNTLGPLLAGRVVAASDLAVIGYSSALFCGVALVLIGAFTWRVAAWKKTVH